MEMSYELIPPSIVVKGSACFYLKKHTEKAANNLGKQYKTLYDICIYSVRLISTEKT